MKIVLLIKRLNYSGAPKILIWLANTLFKAGHNVSIITFLPQKESISLPEEYQWKQIDISTQNILARIYSIRKEIKNHHADVCISFLLDANVYNIFACLGIPTKSIVCERNDPFKPRYYALKFWKPFFRFADGAVYQLPKVAEYYKLKSKTKVIPNPVLVKTSVKIQPFNERAKEVVTLGRIDLMQKRQDILIKAFKLFHSTHPDYTLKIYGDGEENDLANIKSLIQELCLKDCVHLAGVTRSPLETIAKSRIFALTSDFEGMPNALIEAMSLGMPCVSTDCRPGGAALLIKHRENGLLSPMGDIESIAENLSYIADNAEFAGKIGNNAKNIAIQFSEKNIGEEWNSFLSEFA